MLNSETVLSWMDTMFCLITVGADHWDTHLDRYVTVEHPPHPKTEVGLLSSLLSLSLLFPVILSLFPTVNANIQSSPKTS